MTLARLKELIATKQFHHATYRDQGTLWEGLWIYAKDKDGFNGFKPVGSFPRKDKDYDAAYELVRHSGVSLGRFGAG